MGFCDVGWTILGFLLIQWEKIIEKGSKPSQKIRSFTTWSYCRCFLHTFLINFRNRNLVAEDKKQLTCGDGEAKNPISSSTSVAIDLNRSRGIESRVRDFSSRRRKGECWRPESERKGQSKERKGYFTYDPLNILIVTEKSIRVFYFRRMSFFLNWYDSI